MGFRPRILLSLFIISAAICFLSTAVPLAANAVTRSIDSRQSIVPMATGTTSETELREWELTDVTRKIKVKASLPGEVHTALHRGGVIQDPYFGDNVTSLQWVRKTDWIYSTRFTPKIQLDNVRTIIALTGVDTIASLRVNGKVVGRMENAFQEYFYDITHLLRTHRPYHTAELHFQSPATYAEEQSQKYPYSVPGSEAMYGGDPFRNFIRKPQSHFGWDWGPAFETMGVYGAVRIIEIPQASAAILRTTTEVVSDATPVTPATECPTCEVADLSSLSKFTVTSKIVVAFGASYSKRQRPQRDVPEHQLEVSISPKGDAGERSLVEKTIHVTDNNNVVEPGLKLERTAVISAEVDVPRSAVELWYPAGYGKQPLYELILKVVQEGKDTQEKRATIGFRVAEVVTDELSDGETFFFRVNGIPIFAKGSNLIPIDSFESTVTMERVKFLLNSAKSSGQNMLRIWGGGLYQREEIYEVANELGLMIWQEFMFACALYPRDGRFLSSVQTEVEYQVSRLLHHPSVVLFSGNNENQATAQSAGDLYTTDYYVLYDQVVLRALRSVTSHANFWPSSPSNGALMDDWENNMYIQRWGDSQSTRYGDVHRYDYVDDCLNDALFPNPRFASEFGYQSHPSVFTYSAAIPADQLHINSSLLRGRQHHPDGDEQMLAMAQRYFDVETDSYTRSEKFTSTIYLYQLTQALCMKAETEHYRRLRSNASAFTMGTLYWQLNDIWQAPTWASVEYSGRWKMLHYHVQRYYAAVALSVYRDTDNTVVVFGHNDIVHDLSCNMELRFFSRDKRMLSTVNVESRFVSRLSASPVLKVPANKTPTEAVMAVADGKCMRGSESIAVPRADVLLQSLRSGSNGRSPQCSNVQVVHLDSSTDGNTVELTLRSDKTSFYVFLDTPAKSKQNGVFSDNGFVMIDDEVKRIRWSRSGYMLSQEGFLTAEDIEIYCL